MRNALITGATSGIGAAFAKKLAAEGYNLYITGRRKDVIDKLAMELREKYHVDIFVILADFNAPQDIDNLFKKIEGIHFDFLINNVGFGNKKRFFDDSYENQRTMIETHIEAFCKIIHFVAGGMRDSKNGKIINVSSMAAFSPTSFNHLYSSTKAFIITFSEALHMELSPLGINVQALCPGFTRSDFHRYIDVGNELFKNRGLIRWMEADEVADLSLKNVNKNGGLYVAGWSNKILYIIVKLLPRKFYYYIARKIKM